MKKEWFESWFESDLYDLMYEHRDDDEAQAFLSNLLEVLKPQEGAYFLDLACGTGRHSRYIHQQGFHVTGIDLSKRNIALASESKEDGLEFYIQDMRKPARINYYHFVLNLFTSFGYFDDLRDNVRVIKSVKSGLKPNGKFVIDYLNRHYVEEHLVYDEEKTFGEWHVKIERRVIADRLVKSMHWTNGEITRKYAEKVTLFTQAEIEEMLVSQGFQILHLFGDYELSDFSENISPRLIIVSEC